MKTPEPSKESPSAAVVSASIIAAATLPGKKATVCAEVLARLLAGERLTGLDAVAACSTTRLAAVIHHLETGWGWTIERASKAAGCKDGRMTWVMEYRLNDDVIARAMPAGARRWCAEVRAARAAKRAEAAKAIREAARLNAARYMRPTNQPEQRNLFNG